MDELRLRRRLARGAAKLVHESNDLLGQLHDLLGRRMDAPVADHRGLLPARRRLDPHPPVERCGVALEEDALEPRVGGVRFRFLPDLGSDQQYALASPPPALARRAALGVLLDEAVASELAQV